MTNPPRRAHPRPSPPPTKPSRSPESPDTPGPLLLQFPENLTSTHQLLDRLHQQDPAAWDEFAAKYLPELYARATGRLSDGARRLQDTSDIVQDVISEFLAGVDGVQYLHQGSVRAYLTTMIRTHLAQAERANRKRVEDSDVAGADQVPAPETPAIAGLEFEREGKIVQQALAGLSDEERRAVVLTSHGLKPREIARELGRPPGNTTRTFIRRSIQKYKAEFVRVIQGEK